MSPRLSFLLALLLSYSYTLSTEELSIHEQHKEVVTPQEPPLAHPFVRTKILAEGYGRLCDAIEADDISIVEELFKEFPGLKFFAYQPVGSPLHFVRSLAMARFLTEKIGFSVNLCDEWGETPSFAIAQSKPDRFASKKEQQLIARYLKERESTFLKLKSQLINNKNVHMKLSVAAMTGILVTQLAVLIEIFLIKYKTLQGA